MTTTKSKTSSASKSAAKNGPGAAMMETAAANGEAVTQAWFEAWRRSMAMSEEMARFAKERAEHNMRMFQKLATCTTPTEVMDVYSQALHTASDDYVSEVERVKETLEEAAPKS